MKALLLSSVSEYHGGMSDNNNMISDEVVEALWHSLCSNPDRVISITISELTATVNAAAAKMLSPVSGEADLWAAAYKAGRIDGELGRFRDNPYRSTT